MNLLGFSEFITLSMSVFGVSFFLACSSSRESWSSFSNWKAINDIVVFEASEKQYTLVF